jgi:hypothetical protein
MSRPSMSLVLEMNRTSDGRFEGQLRGLSTDPWKPFSGVLELLKVLEESLDLHEAGAPIHPTEGIES